MSARRLTLQLSFVDFDTELDEIRWTFWLSDDRLPEGETFLHVATDRCGWKMRSHHTVIDGLTWIETGLMDGEGLPPEVDGDELELALRFVIREELTRIDLARLLLVHYPPAPFEQAA